MADPRLKNPLVILPSIGNISIDYTERLNTTHSNLITDNPVEASASSSDYIVRKLKTISFVGEFTDFPSTNLIGSYASLKGSSEIKFKRLVSVLESGVPFPVNDGNEVFPSMQFTSLEKIVEDDEFKVRFSATLKEIRKESSTTDSSDASYRGRFSTLAQPKIITGELPVVTSLIA